jgi:hypothetical protein
MIWVLLSSETKTKVKSTDSWLDDEHWWVPVKNCWVGKPPISLVDIRRPIRTKQELDQYWDENNE